MKKLTKPTSLPLLTTAAGCVALVAQLAVRLYAFDQKNLLIVSHPTVIILFILTAISLGLTLLLSRSAEESQVTFPATRGSAIGAIIVLLCVVFHSVRALYNSIDRLSLVLGITTFMVAGCFIADEARRRKNQTQGGLFYGSVSLFLLFYALCRKADWNIIVQPTRIFFPAMVCVFTIMATFYRAYLSVGAKHLKQYLFFHYGAVFFCFGALLDEPVLCGSFIAYLLLEPMPVEIPAIAFPKDVSLCLHKLRKEKYAAYAVGGCVRDSLLGITPNDYDICTNATPEQIAEVFSEYELVRSGEKHGTIGVIMEGNMYEITTFRAEGDYTDGRHPDWVKFVDNLYEDLARRDFTVNAMAYSPEIGYIDPFDGSDDMKNKILRAVGDPETRFTEDALRILRGVRFAVRFHLEPEEKTFEAMVRLKDKLDTLARERVFAELNALLPLCSGEDLIRYAPILTQVIPELAPTLGFEQHSPHHAYDVYTHTAYMVEAVPADPVLRFAALLHDTGKPETFSQDEDGRGHFYGHAAVSANIADEVLDRLKAPTQLRQQVVALIEHHMTELLPEKKFLRKKLAQFGEETLQKLIALQEADFCSKGVEEETEPFTQIRAVLEEVLAENGCLSLKDLQIDGNDLMQMGVQPGPEMGQILNKLLEMVLDETLENEKTALLQAAENLGGTR